MSDDNSRQTDSRRFYTLVGQRESMTDHHCDLLFLSSLSSRLLYYFSQYIYIIYKKNCSFSTGYSGVKFLFFI